MLMGVSSVKSAGRWCQCAMLVGVSSVMISDYIELMQMWCAVVRHILETPVTEREFVEQLHELNYKINFVKEQSFKDARSCLDVRETLDKLKIKVTSRHSSYVLLSHLHDASQMLLSWTSRVSMKFSKIFLDNLAAISWSACWHWHLAAADMVTVSPLFTYTWSALTLTGGGEGTRVLAAKDVPVS